MTRLFIYALIYLGFNQYEGVPMGRRKRDENEWKIDGKKESKLSRKKRNEKKNSRVTVS